MIDLNAANFAKTQLASSITSTQTTIYVASSSNFPAVPFLVVIDSEILKVTAINGTAWTVVRGQEGTLATAHNAGAFVELRWTAGMYNEMKNAINSNAQNIAQLQTTISTKAAVDLSNVNDSTVLSKIKNVDGSNSGLDADLLDGLESIAWALNLPSGTLLYWVNSIYDVLNEQVPDGYIIS